MKIKLKQRSLGLSTPTNKLEEYMYHRQDELDDLYMDIIDILGKNYDGSLPKASSVAEQITFKIEELLEGVYERNEEQFKNIEE